VQTEHEIRLRCRPGRSFPSPERAYDAIVSRRRIWIVSALLLVLLVVAGFEAGRRFVWDDEPVRVATTEAARPKPFVWDVLLDPQGRPYDAPLFLGSTLARRPLTVLHAPSGQVLFMAGERLPFPDAGAPGATLAKRPNRRYPVDAIWEVREKSGLESIVGVVIVERDTPIVRWRVLHKTAYVTDGGVGGITTSEWAARGSSQENELGRLYTSELNEKGRQYFTADVDGHAGVDTIAFLNGWGDGVFPSIAGYDASGHRVEIVLWTKVVPWRLAFPAGKPPSLITAAEDDFAECLAERRLVEGFRCRVAP
jgi:hypothetical protein